jgi:hypothetical protein
MMYKPVPPWLDRLMLFAVCAGFAGLVGGVWFALAIVVTLGISFVGGWLLERRRWTPSPRKQTWVYEGDADTPPAPASVVPEGVTEPTTDTPPVPRRLEEEASTRVQEAPMTPTRALDEIVTALAQLDARLSGDDSPLANPWEEIKDQLKNERSPYWPMYLDIMRQFVTGFVRGHVFSGAAPTGEYGNVECSRIEHILSREQFEEARALGWPATVPSHWSA